MEKLKVMYGAERAGKRMETLILNLRSELLPDKFRRELINTIIEFNPEEVSFPREVKEERPWKTDEFYRYSSAVLSGFYDAMSSWKSRETETKKPEAVEGGKNA